MGETTTKSCATGDAQAAAVGLIGYATHAAGDHSTPRPITHWTAQKRNKVGAARGSDPDKNAQTRIFCFIPADSFEYDAISLENETNRRRLLQLWTFFKKN